MTFGSLFAGIGGFDLGFERAGMTCKWQVEIDDYATRVLEERHHESAKYRDVRSFPPVGDWSVDAICGGFPCQDVSNAGPKIGLAGQRSGLWSEMLRIVCDLRPRYVVVENVSALLIRGMGTVLGDLARCGFDAVWEVLSACAFGASHMRRRVFIMAYSNRQHGWERIRDTLAQQDWSLQAIDGSPRARASWQARLANPSELYRGADGVPFRSERNHAIGNAVCPPVAEWIGRRLMAAEAARLAT